MLWDVVVNKHTGPSVTYIHMSRGSCCVKVDRKACLKSGEDLCVWFVAVTSMVVFLQPHVLWRYKSYYYIYMNIPYVFPLCRIKSSDLFWVSTRAFQGTEQIFEMLFFPSLSASQQPVMDPISILHFQRSEVWPTADETLCTIIGLNGLSLLRSQQHHRFWCRIRVTRGNCWTQRRWWSDNMHIYIYIWCFKLFIKCI